MPLLLELEAFVAAASSAPAPPSDLPVAERRAAAHAGIAQTFLAMVEPGPQLADVRNLRVPVDGGEVPVRVYRPVDAAPLPCHLYFHGGGFWVGTIDHSDHACRDLASAAECVVISVGYRLAPEHPFPTPPEDCYAALCWTVEHAADLGIDPSNVSVGGVSAGGNLAAVLSLMARDRGGPSIVFQVLEIPVIDLTMSFPSVETNGEGYVLTKQGMSSYRAQYLTSTDQQRHPYASPIFADDLSGLPPALVMTAEFDPLRDEGEAYARRLEDAGVPAVARRWEGHIHSSMSFTRISPSARTCQDEIASALRASYRSRKTTP